MLATLQTGGNQVEKCCGGKLQLAPSRGICQTLHSVEPKHLLEGLGMKQTLQRVQRIHFLEGVSTKTPPEATKLRNPMERYANMPISRYMVSSDTPTGVNELKPP